MGTKELEAFIKDSIKALESLESLKLELEKKLTPEEMEKLKNHPDNIKAEKLIQELRSKTSGI